MVTGAGGLVGRALCAQLAAEGVVFCVLSRSPQRAQRLVPGARSYHLWEPIERGSAWAQLVEEARAVVHLASPLVAPGRWTADRRQELYDACVMGTRGIVSALAEARNRPETFVCASSVAYYPFDPTGESPVGEEGPPGEDFLSHLAADWESEAMHAEELGVRTVVLRSALVLGGEGALPRLRRAARFRVATPSPPGSQRQPWIHLEDEIGLLLLALGDGRVRGPLNGVAPDAVSSAQFFGLLCQTLGVPRGMTLPEWLQRSQFAGSAIAATHGRSAVPVRALELGYRFREPELAPALSALLAASRRVA